MQEKCLLIIILQKVITTNKNEELLKTKTKPVVTGHMTDVPKIRL